MNAYRTRNRFTALLAATLFSWPFLVRGLIVYDTFGPGGAYDHNNGTLMAGPNSSFGLFSSGFMFSPAESVYLDTIEVPIGWTISGDGLFALTLQQADRANGMPGTVLETFSALTQGEVNSVLRPQLEAGRSYWLVGVGENDSAVSWQCNSLGLRGSFYSVQGGHEMLLPDQWLSAFRISGTAVPEPSATALIVLGGVSLALASWRSTARPTPSQGKL